MIEKVCEIIDGIDGDDCFPKEMDSISALLGRVSPKKSGNSNSIQRKAILQDDAASGHSSLDSNNNNNNSRFAYSVTGATTKPALLHCDENRLGELLEQMLDTMGVDEAKREAIRRMPKDSKWIMLNQHLAEQQPQAPSSTMLASMTSYSTTVDKSTPDWYVGRLKQYIQRHHGPLSSSGSLNKYLVSLRVSVMTQAMTWVQQFIALGGIDAFLDLFEQCNINGRSVPVRKRDIDFVAELELAKCLKAIMNSKLGLKAIMKLAPRSIDAIVNCLDSDNFIVRKTVMDLLTVVSYTDVPRGHRQVLSSFNKFSKSRNEALLHHTWMAIFGRVVDTRERAGATDGLIAGVGWVGDTKVTEKDITDYLVSNMILINAIVCTPEDLEYRIHLRNQFYAVGFGRIKDHLMDIAQGNEYLRRQMDQFDSAMAFDWAQFSSMVDDLRADERDPQKIFKQLVRSVEGTSAFAPFLSLMQHFLLIRQDPRVQTAYFKLIDLIVGQILLDGKGIDPDFGSVYPVNVQTIVDHFCDAEELYEARQEIDRLKQTVQNLLEHKASSGGAVLKSVDGIHASGSFEQLASSTADHELEKRLDRHHSDLSSLLNSLCNVALSTSTATASGGDAINKLDWIMDGLVPDAVQKQLDDLVAENMQLRAQLKDAGLRVASRLTAGSAILGTVDANGEVSVTATQEGTDTSTSLPELDLKLMAPPPPPPPPTIRKPAKKQYYKARNKLKPLQWEKIADHDIDATLWKNVTKEGEYAKALEQAGLFGILEREFAAIDVGATGAKTSVGSGATQKKKSETELEEVSVIDAKKAYNLMILLSRMKKDTAEIMDAIHAMDTARLSPQLAQQLLSFAPSPDEIGSLSKYANSIPPNLSKADTFLVHLLKVDHYELRLRFMIFRSNFEEQFKELKESIDKIDDATQVVRHSDSFKQFLELVLTVGNIMNDKGFRGNAYGFRVVSLTSIIDTKSVQQPDETLLHFLIDLASSHFPKAIEFTQSMAGQVNNAARIAPSVISLEFEILHDTLKELAKDFQKANIVAQLPFLNKSLSLMDQAANKLETVMRHAEDLVKWLGEDVKEVKWDDVMKTLSMFISMCRRVEKELKEKKLKTASSSSQTNLATSTSITKTSNTALARVEISKPAGIDTADSQSIGEEDSKGVMDSLLDSLRKGNIPRRVPEGTVNVLSKRALERRRVSYGQYGQQAAELLMQLDQF